MNAADVVIVVGAMALAVLGGWPVSGLVLRLAARSPDAGAPAPEGTEEAGARARIVLGGGTWIGLLERFGTAGCILLGYPEGAAFVLAVKGLGRYPELRERPEASERFVIGTLASLTWAAGVALIGRALLG